MTRVCHDDVIKWKHLPRYWPFVGGIHRSPVNSPHKGQWRGPLMFSLICAWIDGWVNNGEAGDLRCYRAHYDVIVMFHVFSARPRQMRTDACNAFSQQLKPCSAPVCSPYHQTTIPENKVNGANMGLIWGRQDPGGPRVGPMKLDIRDFANIFNLCIIRQSFDDCKGL